MLIRLLIYFVIICPSFHSQAQKIVNTIGEATVRLEYRGMTVEEAKAEALLQARLNAIEKAFGTVIRGESHTWIKTTSGKKIGTETTFDFIANNYLKGEWISDIGEPEINTIQSGDEIWYKCKIKCKVRELKERKVEFEAYPLSCPQKTCKTETFNNGQKFFFYFKSAEKGFLTIFFATEGEYFRLLPYKQVPNNLYNCFTVEADKEYIFLSEDNVYYNETVDEMVLTTEYSNELNIIWVLFSPEEFSKPILQDKSKELLDKSEIENNYTMPKSINAENFLKWVQKIRTKNYMVQIDIFGITIKK